MALCCVRKGGTPCGGRDVLGAVGQGRERVLCGSLVLIEGARREGERDYDGRLSKRERERERDAADSPSFAAKTR